ncbi:transmembrane protein, partial [Thraustotheca clavata]
MPKAIVRESDPLMLNLTAIMLSVTETASIKIEANPPVVQGMVQNNLDVQQISSGQFLTLRLTKYWFGALQINITVVATQNIVSPRFEYTISRMVNATILPVAYAPLLKLTPAQYGVMGKWMALTIDQLALIVNRSAELDQWTLNMTCITGSLNVMANQTLLTPVTTASTTEVYSLPLQGPLSVFSRNSYGGVYTVTIQSTDVVSVSNTSVTSKVSTTFYIAGIEVITNATIMAQGTSIKYSFIISSPPQQPVILWFNCNDTSRLIMPSPITATTNKTYQTLLTSKRDFMDNGNNTVLCSVNINTTDAYYQQITLPNATHQLVNSDVSGFSLTGTTVNNRVQLTVAEGGFTDSYTVSLSSKPYATVTLTLTTNVSSLRPTPLTLSFTQENWNVPQTVVASATKDSNTIGSIPAFIKHSIQSDDAKYTALGSLIVLASLLVTEDTTPPPSLQIAQFGNSGADMVVTFAQAVDRSTFANPLNFACSIVFSYSENFFGSSPKCGWVTSSSIRILFGKSPTVIPGDKCTVLGGLKSTPTSLLSMRTSYILIQSPASPPVPLVSVSGQLSLGSCDDLFLDGRASSGSGGRAMQWIWNVSDSDDLRAFTIVAGNSSQTLSIPSSNLTAGASYTFSLTLTNFFGASSTSGPIAVTKSNMPLPIVSIKGPSTVAIFRSSSILFTSTASPASCGNTDTSNIALNFQWYIASTGPLTLVTSTSRNPRQLKLPARYLDYGTYQIQVFVWVTAQPTQNNTATVTAQIVPNALVSIITGGFRAVGNQNDLPLNGTASYDPDSSTTALIYMWQCKNAATGAASCGGYKIANGSMSTIPQSYLPPKTNISITLTVLDTATQRTSSTSVTFTIVLGNPPSTSIAPMTQEKYNPDSKIAMAGIVTSSIDSAPTALWTIQGDASQAIANATFGFSRTSLTMLLLPNTLQAGNSYTFILTGTDKFGQSSAATIYISINQPPSSGTLVSEPKSGSSLVTNFALSSLNWVDVDLPLMFAFKYIVGPVVANQSEVTLGDYALTTTFNTILPKGSGENSTITIVGYIADSYGCATKAYTTVSVSALSGSAESQQAILQNQSSQLATMAASNDPGSVLNMVNMLASMLTPMVSTTTGSGSSVSSTTPTPTASSGSTPSTTSVPLMQCPTNSASLVCSGHGTCTLNPPNCAFNNLDCTATCTCASSWYYQLHIFLYNLDCGTSQAEYNKKQEMLGNLLTAMATASSNVQPTPEAVEQQTAAVQSITSNTGLLSPSQQTQALDLVANVLSSSSTVQLSTTATAAVGNSISNLMDASSSTTDSTSRRRLSDDATAQEKSEKISSTVSLLASAMLNGVLPGEETVELSTKNVKLALQRHDPSTLGGEVSLPLTASQIKQNYTKPTFILPENMSVSDACNQAIDTHATLYSQNLYQFSSNGSLNSGVMGLKIMCDYAATPFPVANLTTGIKIRLRALSQYTIPGPPKNGSMACLQGKPMVINITCDAEQDIHKVVSCNGTSNYTLQYTCPQYIPTPKCQYWDTKLSAWSTDGCKQLPDADPNYILCECNHLTDFSSQVDLAYKAVADNFIAVMDHHTTLSDVTQNLDVVITMGVFVVHYIVSLLFCIRWDRKDRIKFLQQHHKMIQESQKIDLSKLFQLPKVVAAKTRREKFKALLQGVWEGLKEGHHILNAIMKYDENFTRPQRVMIIFTATMSQMFINALLYQLRQMTPNAGTMIVSGVVSSVCMMPVTLAFAILFRKAGKTHDYTVRYEIEDEQRVVEVQVDAYGNPIEYSKYDMLRMDLQGILNATSPQTYSQILGRLKRENSLTTFASAVSQTLYLVLHNREVRDPEPLEVRPEDVDALLLEKSSPSRARKNTWFKKAPNIAMDTKDQSKCTPSQTTPTESNYPLISVEQAVAKLAIQWEGESDLYSRLNKLEPTSISSTTRSKLSYMIQQAIGLQKQEMSALQENDSVA